MSTELSNEKQTFHFTRFYGGSERGRCYQITQKDGQYVQLTELEVIELTELLDKELYRLGYSR